jgi:hypothetical protein
MSDNNKQGSTISQMSDLFGEPPLIRGEDIARYWRLHAAIEHDIKPETVFEKIYVRELTDKLWQQQRCKQSAASLVEGAYIEALASLLRPFIIPPIVSIDKDAATEMARDYYSGDAKAERVKEVEARLAVNQISREQIRAKAMQLCGSGISMFNRMETNCEASLRMLRKENARRSVVEDANAPGSDELEGDIVK